MHLRAILIHLLFYGTVSVHIYFVLDSYYFYNLSVILVIILSFTMKKWGKINLVTSTPFPV